MTTEQTATARAVASLAEFEAADGWLTVSVLGEPWLVTRLDGELVAVRDECPHRRVPLSAGQRVASATGQAIACRYHGWQFAGSGECLAIPALGAGAAVPRGMRVGTAAVELRDGLLWLAR